MSTRACATRVLLVALAGAMAAGCTTPVGRYLSRRGADLGDCVWAEAGVGWPIAPFYYPRGRGEVMGANGEGSKPVPQGPTWRELLLPHLYVRLKVTDYMVIGDGFTQPLRYGWRGRYRASGRALPIATGLPFYSNNEETAGTAVLTRWVVHTTRTYGETEPGPGGRTAEKFWAGLSLTLIASVRLDFNGVELADFLTGWFGLDLLGDDDWPEKEEAKK